MANGFELIKGIVGERIQYLHDESQRLEKREEELSDKMKQLSDKAYINKEGYEELSSLAADLADIYNQLGEIKPELGKLLAEYDGLDRAAKDGYDFSYSQPFAKKTGICFPCVSKVFLFLISNRNYSTRLLFLFS